MEQVIEVAAVDDHPIVLAGLTSLLDGAPGVRVVATARGVDELLAGPGRRAAVVLLDLDLGDGTCAADNIRRLLATGAAVVVFSVTAAPATVRAAMGAGAACYVPKTENVDDLLTAIRAAAGGVGGSSRSSRSCCSPTTHRTARRCPGRNARRCSSTPPGCR